MLDGLDEVPDEQPPACKEAVESYAGRAAPFRAFVLTCRLREYGELAPDLVAADRQVALIGLDRAQIVNELDRDPHWNAVQDRVTAGDASLFELLRSPLRLTTALMAYRRGSPDELIDIELGAAEAHLWDLTLAQEESGFDGHGPRTCDVGSSFSPVRWCGRTASGSGCTSFTACRTDPRRQRLALHAEVHRRQRGSADGRRVLILKFTVGEYQFQGSAPCDGRDG